MASSMLSGERRWASARKGGMTVLGKVAVPKPINLPSQRLENHGLDPNVEIVPKGTHIWGSRSSSSSNAWGSSSLSPNAEGGTGSPSYISGRPSSGGTGTRPSTAGSERANDAITIAWGSNSRPSSSSRVLTSNQTSQTALRPRSAETRPGSSHLSRFAEPLSDNLVAWGGSGTSEKLGVTSSKNDGFSLSTGDFPELGSEKENSGKTTDSQDHGSHGCPGSSCGVVSGKECIGNSTGDVSVNVNVKIGTAGAWRKENSLYGEDGARSNVEKWHVDPQLYPNNNMPPQHYDAWHGPPVNSHPSGVWYRGPPGGPPFGSPVAPGGFPMEPFPYYHPQMPPPPLANPQPVPPPGTGPRAPHPKNGDMYRPHMHDAYIRPGMPLRPGFYSGPVPYDGYYGPPMSYCNSNDRDVPFIGMAMGPAAYNRYTGQNVPDSGNCLVRTSGYGTSKMMVSEQVGAVHPQDARGPYKVLLKQHDSWEGKDEVQKWDETLNTDASYSLKGEHSRKSSWENGWRSDDKKDEEMDTRRMTLDGGASYEAVDNRAGPLKVKSPETVGSRNASDMSSVKKFDHAASKDSSLIQKIEGLNAKARACDVRQDVKSVSSGEEQKNNLQTGDATACHSTNEAGNASLSHEKSYGSGINSAPHEDRFSAGDKSLESTVISGTAIFRRSTHGRADHRGKGRFNKQEADGWRKKSHFVESPSTASTAHNELSSVSHGSDHNFAEAIQNSVSHASGKDDGESMPPVSDLNDSQAQHAKRRELAKRLKQREKEEEERTREQRAKALAKLEELNRRTQAGESVTQKLETVSSCAIHSRQESLTPAPPTMSASKSGAPNSSLGSSTNRVAHIREKLETVAGSVIQNRHEESSTAAPPTVVASKSRASGSAPGSSHSMIAQSSESSENRVEKSASVVSCISLGTPKTTYNESVIVHEQSKPFQQDGNYVDSPNRSSSWVQESSTSMQKRIGYKQKQNMEKNSNEKSIPSSVTEASKGHSDIATNTITSSECTAHEIASNCETNLSVKLSVAAEPSAHHRKNRSGKNRHKVEAASSAAVLPSKESKDAATLDTSVESVKSKASEKMSDHSSVQVPTNLNDANQSLELRSSLANEEGNIRVNNQWKSQHARRMMRNSQGNRSADKNHGSDNIIWAPVRSQNKIEVSDEANQNVSVEAVVSSTKSDQLVQNNPRNKRAEMERYVPKPVAKELSQHSSSHQAIVPSCNQVTSDEFIEMSESSSLGAESSQISTTAAGKVGSTMESRNGDFRPNKPGKVHGSWRQRGTTESTTNTGRNSQRSIEDHQHQETDETSMREKPRHSGEWNASDSWNMPENPDTPVIVPVLKGQDVSARGKRHPHKGQKGMGANHNSDEKRTVSVDSRKIYMQSTPEVHQLDSSVAAKENHIVGERSTSHWQPKSQALPTASQQGSRPNSSVNVVESGRVNKESFLNVHHGQSLSQKSIFEEASDVGWHQEPKRERKTAGQRGRSDSPVELTSHSTTDVQHDQRKSAGLCKNGSANSRYGIEHESRGEWSGSGKDNKQHNLPAIRERQRQNSHYEYQPVGPQNNNKTNDFEPPKERPHNSRSRYRERGQSH